MAWIEGSAAEARLSPKGSHREMFTKVEELECFPFSLESKGSQCCLLLLHHWKTKSTRNLALPALGFFWAKPEACRHRVVECQVHAIPLSSINDKVNLKKKKKWAKRFFLKKGKGKERTDQRILSTLSLSKLGFWYIYPLPPPLPALPPAPMSGLSWEPGPDFIIQIQAPRSCQGNLPGPALFLLFFLVENSLLQILASHPPTS